MLAQIPDTELGFTTVGHLGQFRRHILDSSLKIGGLCWVYIVVIFHSTVVSAVFCCNMRVTHHLLTGGIRIFLIIKSCSNRPALVFEIFLLGQKVLTSQLGIFHGLQCIKRRLLCLGISGHVDICHIPAKLACAPTITWIYTAKPVCLEIGVIS